MSTWAVSMIKDESDVVEGMLRHLVDEVDHLLVADNGSTDGTREILDQLAGELPLTVVDDPDPAYRQSAKMSALAERAAEGGATWILPVDADELWWSRFGRIRDILAPVDADVAPALLTNHFCTSLDPPGDDPFVTMQWRQAEPQALPKVAFRWREGAVIHQGNHGVTLPGRVVHAPNLVELRHFPYRTAEQMVRKAINGAAAYKAADGLPEEMGVHWRAYGRIVELHGPEALAGVFRQHFWYLSPTDSGMVHDPAPYRRWQTA